MSDWDFWHKQLAGQNPETTPGQPHCGFYRSRQNEAIAIWKTGNSFNCTLLKNGSAVHSASIEYIDNLFSRVCRTPITEEAFRQIETGGDWDDAIEKREEVDGSSAEAMAQEVSNLTKLANNWYASLPSGICDEATDRKAANYVEAIASIKRQAEATHKHDKSYWLEGGRKVDQLWKPVIESADSSKRIVAAWTTAYRVKRAEEEAKRVALETARLLEEKKAQIDAGERPAPIQAPRAKPTGLRTFKRVEITDMKALAMQIIESNHVPDDFIDAMKKFAKEMMAAGLQVNGAHMVDDVRAQ